MTITFLDLYNDVTGQAWSMFDGDVEAQDEFESTVTTSIQKALSALWCSYKFPFRNKTMTFDTEIGVNAYDTPNGNIIQKTVNRKKVYCVKYNNKFLDYEPDFEILEDKEGEPEKFYIKNDELLIYPIPDNNYEIEVEYRTIFACKNEDDEEKANLQNESDYIDIPEKYEDMFKCALLPLSMLYLIASREDENTSGYKEQYESAYKILIDYCRGLDIDKRIGWR